jgi:phosphate transport system substrate-binding protein
LKLVGVDGGSGCVTPSVEAVTAERYQPLTRPIFIYVNRASATRPAVQALARAYVSPESSPYALQVGYVPLPIAPLLYIARRLDREQTGSMFGNRGSVVGVTADLLMDEEKIGNALLR